LDVLEHCERKMAENPSDEDVAFAVERITGAAELAKVEGGWRVPISDVLRYHAGLDKEVVTVGFLNHAVLWSRERWEQAQEKRLHSPEVRRAQGEMMRAAASSIRKKADAAREEIVKAEESVEQSDVGVIATGTGGIVTPGRDANTNRAAPAPAGDGKRSARVLTLSQLGR